MEDRVLFQSEGMGLFGMGERKRDFNRIFKTIRRMKGGDNQEKRAKNGILFFLLLLSREFFGSMRSISIRIEDIPRIIEPSSTAVRVHKGGGTRRNNTEKEAER